MLQRHKRVSGDVKDPQKMKSSFFDCFYVMPPLKMGSITTQRNRCITFHIDRNPVESVFLRQFRQGENLKTAVFFRLIEYATALSRHLFCASCSYRRKRCSCGCPARQPRTMHCTEGRFRFLFSNHAFSFVLASSLCDDSYLMPCASFLHTAS